MGKVMSGYKRCYVRELWRNRLWKYFPDVIRYMKRFPLGDGNFKIWLRNCLYVNWQPVLVKR